MEKIEIKTKENINSEIIILEDLMSNIQNYFEDKKYFLITNTTLAKLYPEIIYKFNNKRVIIIKDGEKYKNFKTFNKIIEKLLKEKIERKDSIVAFGGGVVGDLAGFVASSVLRGVELIQIPTTLLAMCDSAIGGKTGYNTIFGKNLVGSFYLAKKVLIDTLFLNTLNKYEYKCGLGEIIKYALIEKSAKNNEFFNLLDFLEKNQIHDIKYQMPYIVKVCASIKANVVELDRLEGNLRKILNFGHTFAHPIETIYNYKKISHGQAVAYGIKSACKLGYNLGKINKEYYDRIINLIDKFELTDKKIKYKKEDFIELMKQDKKIENGKINLLVPTHPSTVELFDNIDLPLIEACLP